MSFPLARTSAEAHLYMDLHPCPCGEADFPRQHAVVAAGDDLASRYTGACPRCGAAREFLFRLPEQVLVPRAGEVVYGGPEPSELFDPGEWLRIADAYATRVPASLAGLPAGRADRARRDLACAAAAVDEAMKFIPEGADAVPSSAFASERGSAVYATEPGRFRRSRLHAVADAYRSLLAR